MKYLVLILSLPILILSSSLANSQNLAVNPGFELMDDNGNPVSWSAPAEVYSVDNRIAHSSNSSLRIVSTDPKVYLLATQTIPFQPGHCYKASVWVKTEDVKGPNSGAALAVQWAGKEGYLGGTYSDGVVDLGIKGTQDWTRLELMSAPIPEEATSVEVVLYLKKGMTGTAWFDDMTVTPYVPPTPALTSFVLSPNYRGYIFPDQAMKPVRVSITIGNPLSGDLGPNDVTLLVNKETVKVDGKTQSAIVTISPTKLAYGQNRIDVELKTVNGDTVLAHNVHILQKFGTEDKMPKVYIDSFNRTMLDRKPFFPIGVYSASYPNAQKDSLNDLDIISKSAFNCTMNYAIASGNLETIRGYLDAAEARKLKVIFSIKDVYEGTPYFPKEIGPFKGEAQIVNGVVKEFAAHPALLAWYINDELPTSYIPRIEARHQEMVRLDTDHPTWEVLCQVNELNDYKNTTDVLGTDPYPIPEAPISMVSRYVDNTRKAVESARPIWMAPQCMNWSVYNPGSPAMRGPTYEEMRNMTFQCLVGGAKGLVYYAFHDLKRDPAGFDKPWSDLCKVAEEVKGLTTVLLSVEMSPNVGLKQPNADIRYAAWSCEGRKMLMAVNTSRNTQRATFVLPSTPNNLKRLNEVGDISLSGVELTDDFAPVAVHLYEWE
ncbi:MAG: hypothetical protein ACYC64_04990 [Armatimonadota bacterium]